MGTPLTQWTLRDWWTAWGGAALIVIPSFVFTLLSLAGGSDEAGTVGRLALALVFGGLVALLTLAAYRRGAQGFALGVAGGYGLLTLVSGGQCTLLMPSRSGGLGRIYLLFVVVGFAGLAVASLVKAVMGKDL